MACRRLGPGRRAWRVLYPTCVGVSLLAIAMCTGCAGASRPPQAATPAPAAPIVEVVPQRDWSDAVLYFIIVDRYADADSSNDYDVERGAKGTFHGGDLDGVRERLDDLADLGVTALWITPVVTNIPGFVTGAGFPDWAYHGYWADDFTSVDRRFGTEDELRALVEEAHARGMKVLLDVVYNHCGYGSRYVTDPATKAWLRTEQAGTCGQDDLTQCVAGLPDFKTELPEVADYLMKAHIDRAARVGLDGFRLDTVKHVGHPFWDEHRRRTRERLGRDFFLLGEVWGGDARVLDPWFEPDEMDAGFDFSFQGNTIAFVQGRGRAVAYDAYLAKRFQVRQGHHLAHFLSSHDVPTALYLLGDDVAEFRLAVLLQMTALGIPVVYYGEEVGRVGGDWPENRSDMPWGDLAILPGAGLPRDEALRGYYKKLIAIRRAHPALSRGEHRGLQFGKDLLVFERVDGATGETVVVAVNRGATPVEASFPRPAGWAGAAVRDVLAGEDVAIVGDGVTLTVTPMSGRILARE